MGVCSSCTLEQTHSSQHTRTNLPRTNTLEQTHSNKHRYERPTICSCAPQKVYEVCGFSSVNMEKISEEFSEDNKKRNSSSSSSSPSSDDSDVELPSNKKKKKVVIPKATTSRNRVSTSTPRSSTPRNSKKRNISNKKKPRLNSNNVDAVRSSVRARKAQFNISFSCFDNVTSITIRSLVYHSLIPQ